MTCRAPVILGGKETLGEKAAAQQNLHEQK
jgi:hypothetical protein